MRAYTTLLTTLSGLLLLGSLSLAPRGRAEGEAPWKEAPLKIEPVADANIKFRTPNDGYSASLSLLRGNWLDVTSGELPLKGVKGGPIKFSPTPAKMALDLDGDGTYETQGKDEVYPVKVQREGGALSNYVFRLRREVDGSKWYFQRACMATGEIEKTRIAILDDDNDGAFNTLTKDVIWVAGMQGAGYLGKLLVVKGKLYEVSVDASGTKINYRPWAAPADAPPGKIDPFTGYRAQGKSAGKPSIVLVQKVGEPEMVFDVNVKGGQVVPAGEYELLSMVVGPSRDQVCVVTKGKMQSIVVKPGETTALQWGPFPGSIEFSMTKSDNLVSITSSSVELYGRMGERYEKFYPVSYYNSCEMVEKVSRKRVFFGSVDVVHDLRVACQVPFQVRVFNDNIDFLGPFASEWKD